MTARPTVVLDVNNSHSLMKACKAVEEAMHLIYSLPLQHREHLFRTKAFSCNYDQEQFSECN